MCPCVCHLLYSIHSGHSLNNDIWMKCFQFDGKSIILIMILNYWFLMCWRFFIVLSANCAHCVVIFYLFYWILLSCFRSVSMYFLLFRYLNSLFEFLFIPFDFPNHVHLHPKNAPIIRISIDFTSPPPPLLPSFRFDWHSEWQKLITYLLFYARAPPPNIRSIFSKFKFRRIVWLCFWRPTRITSIIVINQADLSTRSTAIWG